MIYRIASLHTAICLGRRDEMQKYEKCSYYANCNIKQMAKLIEKYKTCLQEIKTIAKLKREMITKDDIQDLKNTAKKFVEERNSLRFENERLKEELATYGATGVCEVCSDKANKLADKYLRCLQEIKKYIAKICKEECGYVPKKRCPDCDCRYGAILDLITKAEVE